MAEKNQSVVVPNVVINAEDIAPIGLKPQDTVDIINQVVDNLNKETQVTVIVKQDEPKPSLYSRAKGWLGDKVDTALEKTLMPSDEAPAGQLAKTLYDNPVKTALTSAVAGAGVGAVAGAFGPIGIGLAFLGYGLGMGAGGASTAQMYHAVALVREEQHEAKKKS